MTETRQLFQLGGLTFTMRPSALLGALVLVIVLSGLGVGLRSISTIEAILFGVLATLLHFLSEIIHQFGHAIAARRTGYPMIGVELWLIFGASVYPEDEPELPANVHIRRALGGPIISIIVSILAGVLILLLQGTSGLLWWLVLWVFVINLLVFGFGAFVPLGFTDGSTLLYWRRR